jgi:hypothetical protein
MSFAFAHQNKTNKTGDNKKSTSLKHSSYPHINNLEANDSPNSILYLQRAIGNQAVQRLINSNNNTSRFHFAKIGILQPKLKVSQPGDEYEQEACRMAEQVMATQAHLAASSAPLRIQRLAHPSAEQADSTPARARGPSHYSKRDEAS